MFARIGSLSIRYRWVVIIIWILLAVLLTVFAPSLSKVGVTDQLSFLPANAPSVQAGLVIHERFPEDSAIGDTIVFFRAAGLSESDMDYARQVGAWLESSGAPAEVSGVISVFSRPELKSMLQSLDGTTLLMSLEFSTGVSSAPTNEAVSAIREHLLAAPAGLEIYTAGSASIARDTLLTVQQSMDRTTWATVLLVVVILLIIYRSPVAVIVPLATISVAYLVSRGVLGYLAQAGVKMSTQMDIFAIVVVFGVGTDYCLFIVSRYREELHRLPTRFEAGVRTMEKIGAVIAASATVVMLAFLFLNVADFGLTRTLGTGLAIAILVTLLAGLTLTPALMSAMGDRLFWPFSQEQGRSEHGFWHRLAVGVSRHAAWVVPVVIAVLLIPYLYLPRMVRSFDILADVPASMDSARGFDTLKGHFDPGEIFPTTVMMVAGEGRIADHLADVDSLASQLRAVPGVSRVRSLLTPTGDPGEADLFLVDRQLALLVESLNSMSAGLSGGAQGATPQTADPISALGALLKYLPDLAEAYPAVKDMPDYASALAAAQNLDKQAASLVGQMLVTTQLETIAEQIGALSLGLRSPLLAAQPEALAEQAENLTLLRRYLSGLGEAFPFIKANAQYARSLASLEEIEKGVAQVQKSLFVSGQLNVVADSMDGLAKQLDNPASLLQLNASENLSVFRSYLIELAERYPWVASEASFAQIGRSLTSIAGSAAKLQGGQVSMADLPGILTTLKSEVSVMAEAVRGLSASFASRSPDAVFIPKDLPSGMANPETMGAQVEALGIALMDVARVFAQTQPDARYMPAEALSGVSGQVGARLSADLQALSANLSGMSQRFLTERAYLYPKALLSLYPGAASLEKVFVSEDGAATRMYAILEPEPYSNEALDVSLAIRDQASAGQVGGEVYITGSSIAFADIRQISNEDFMKVLILTLLGVLAVMILLLRSVVAPLYLVLTVLLSYGCTMGLTVFLFQVLLKQGGVNLLIPTVVLVLLLALGADYNIFLMSRVREETRGTDFVQGLVNATSRTGAIISSCGIVLAGTFATMMLSPMTMLLQIGASVAFGVLLDTFVIRGILVPGIARLLQRRNWWPARE